MLKTSFSKLTLVLAITTALSACGGGSSSTTPVNNGDSSNGDNSNNGDNTDTPTALDSHTVTVPGYQSVRVFMDVNGDLAMQADEPSGLTAENGKVTLDVKDIDDEQNYLLVANFVPGVTKRADGQPAVQSAQQLIAPPLASVISPLSHYVADKLKSGGELADAVAAAASDIGLSQLDIAKDYIAQSDEALMAISTAFQKVYFSDLAATEKPLAAKQVAALIKAWKDAQNPLDWNALEVVYQNEQWQIAPTNPGDIAADKLSHWGELPKPVDGNRPTYVWKNDSKDTFVILASAAVTEAPLAYTFDPALGENALVKSDALTEHLNQFKESTQLGERLRVHRSESNRAGGIVTVKTHVKTIELDGEAPNYQHIEKQYQFDQALNYKGVEGIIQSIEVIQPWLESPWALVHVAHDSDGNGIYIGGYVLMRIVEESLVANTGLNEGQFYEYINRMEAEGHIIIGLPNDQSEDLDWYALSEAGAKVVVQGDYPMKNMTLRATAKDNKGNQTWCFDYNERTLCRFYDKNSDTWQAPFLLEPQFGNYTYRQANYLSLDYNPAGVLAVATEGYDTTSIVGQYYPDSNTWYWQEKVGFYNLNDDAHVQLDNAGNWLLKLSVGLGAHLNFIAPQSEYKSMLEESAQGVGPLLLDSGAGIYINYERTREQQQVYLVHGE